MPKFNGLIASLTKGSSTGGEHALLTGTSLSPIGAMVPAKHFENAIFAVQTSGISGTYAVLVVGAVGGATFVIAGATGIGANGSTLLGTSVGVAAAPRPAYVAFSSAEAATGFTSSVFMAGEY